MKGLFITGTDTDVGKTYVGAQLVSLLHKRGISVQPRKPIESGCTNQDGELIPADATHYFNAVEQKISLQEICPYRFEPAISPQRAARLVNQLLYVDDVYKKCIVNINENDFLFVEGAGGFYSPLFEDGLNADLVKALQLPVLLVANDKLGCINHILLTTEAIQQQNLNLSVVVMNRIDPLHDEAMDNVEDLKSLVEAPVFAIDRNEKLTIDSEIIKHILK